METYVDRMATHADIAARIDELEQAVGVGDIPHAANEEVIRLQEGLQHHVAEAASKLMTGVRGKDEMQDFLETYAMYRRLLGLAAHDHALRVYDESGDSDITKREVYDYLAHWKHQMVSLDFEMRLGSSKLERIKQWLALHPKERFAASIAASGAATSAATVLFLEVSEATSRAVEISPAHGGVAGVIGFIGGAAAKSMMRNGPPRVGMVLQSKVHVTVGPYVLKGPRADDTALTGEHARYHLKQTLRDTREFISGFELESRNDLAEMVGGALDISEASLLESYGIEPEEERQKPWYRRMMGRMALVQ